MRNINPFVIKTLIFAVILFSLVTLAHGVAIAARDSLDTVDYNESEWEVGSKERSDNENETDSPWDIEPMLNNVAAILVGIDMPMPFPIIITAFNVILLMIILYDISEIIKAWIPLL